MNFRKEAKVQQEKSFATPNGRLLLDSDDNDVNKDFNGRITNEVHINLEGYDGNELKLEQTFQAKGSTRQEAEANAKSIVYNIVQKDSALVFDRNIDLAEKSRFRGQELSMKLFLPFNKQFKMTKDFYYNVYRWGWHEERNFEMDGDDVDKYTYVMKKDSGMVCLDCPKLNEEEKEALNNRRDDFDGKDGSFNYGVFENEGQHRKEFNLKDFNRIEAGGAFIVTVKKGEGFSIKADSDEQDNLDDLSLKVRNNTLEIEYEDRFSFRRREGVRFIITMPSLEGIDFSGASVIKVIGFEDKSNDLEIDLSGSSKAAIDVEVRKIEFDASGASVADIRGVAQDIDIDVSGACHVDARQLEVENADAQASGASRIKFGKITKSYNVDTSGASKVSRE
jgi:Putative auto-transporter adhesin, head GIN domain